MKFRGPMMVRVMCTESLADASGNLYPTLSDQTQELGKVKRWLKCQPMILCEARGL